MATLEQLEAAGVVADLTGIDEQIEQMKGAGWTPGGDGFLESGAFSVAYPAGGFEPGDELAAPMTHVVRPRSLAAPSPSPSPSRLAQIHKRGAVNM